MDYNEAIQWVWRFFGSPMRFTVVVDGIIVCSMTAVVPPLDAIMEGDWGPYPSIPVTRGPQHLAFTFNSPEAFLGAEPWGDGLKIRFGRNTLLRRRQIAELVIVPQGVV